MLPIQIDHKLPPTLKTKWAALGSKDRRIVIVIIVMFVAVGCTNMIPPDNAWLKRSNNDIVIGCYLSQQTWQLKCDGHEWKGQVGECVESGKTITLLFACAHLYHKYNLKTYPLSRAFTWAGTGYRLDHYSIVVAPLSHSLTALWEDSAWRTTTIGPSVITEVAQFRVT